jgi:hypothetical protein
VLFSSVGYRPSDVCCSVGEMFSLARVRRGRVYRRMDKVDSDGSPTLIRRLKIFNEKFPEVPVRDGAISGFKGRMVIQVRFLLLLLDFLFVVLLFLFCCAGVVRLHAWGCSRI